MVINKEKAFSLAETLLTMAIICLFIAASMKVFTGKHNKIRYNTTHGYFMCYRAADGNIYQKLGDQEPALADQVNGCKFSPITAVSYYVINSIGGGAGGSSSADGAPGVFDSSFYSALANNLYIIPGQGGEANKTGSATTITPADTNNTLKTDYTKEILGGSATLDGSAVLNDISSTDNIYVTPSVPLDKVYLNLDTNSVPSYNISKAETGDKKSLYVVSNNSSVNNRYSKLKFAEEFLDKFFVKYKDASFPATTIYNGVGDPVSYSIGYFPYTSSLVPISQSEYSDDKYWTVEDGKIVYDSLDSDNYKDCILKSKSINTLTTTEIQSIFTKCKIEYDPAKTEPLKYFNNTSNSNKSVYYTSSASATFDNLAPEDTDYGKYMYRTKGNFKMVVKLNTDVSKLSGSDTAEMIKTFIQASGYNNNVITTVLNSNPGKGGTRNSKGSSGVVFITW